MCKYCELFLDSVTTDLEKPFIQKGASLGTHPTRVLEKHDGSKRHKFSVQRYTCSRGNVNVYKQVQMAFSEQEYKRNRTVVKKIFQCVDFLVRQKWAVTENTEKLARFVTSMGDSVLKAHCDNTLSKTSYLSSQSVTQMVQCISDFHERELLSQMKDKEFSLLADESTDIANRSQLCVMARFGNSDDDNHIATNFLGFVNLTKGTAEAIMEAIKSFLQAKDIDFAKIRFIATQCVVNTKDYRDESDTKVHSHCLSTAAIIA